MGREKYLQTQKAEHIFELHSVMKLSYLGKKKTLEEFIEAMDLFSGKYKFFL